MSTIFCRMIGIGFLYDGTDFITAKKLPRTKPIIKPNTAIITVFSKPDRTVT